MKIKSIILTGVLSITFGSLVILLIIAHVLNITIINKYKNYFINFIFLIFIIFYTCPLELLYLQCTPINSENLLIYFRSFLFYFKILFVSNFLVVLSIFRCYSLF